MGKTPVFVVGGPAGSGKTTVCERVSELERFAFIEGDSLHPRENIDKMTAGVPLTDDDRWPWLECIVERAKELARDDSNLGVILTCSALKKRYRDRLRKVNDQADVSLDFIFLRVSEDELRRRMATRKGHYMKPGMLESQLRDLEMPEVGEEPHTEICDADHDIDTTERNVLRIIAKVLARDRQ
ncbi:hypothetical protein PYCC9005_004603 [Savitreella phatthalungensis]